MRLGFRQYESEATRRVCCNLHVDVSDSLNLLGRLRDGSHGLGSASLLAATAASALAGLGLLGSIEWWQDGECLSHSGNARWCWSLLEPWAGCIVGEVVAKELSIADVGGWSVAGLQ